MAKKMPETFLILVLDTSSFLTKRHRNFEHLNYVIQQGKIQIAGLEIHIPYAVKQELRFHATNHSDPRVQNQALDARRWLADYHDGLTKQTWLENSPVETLFPSRPRDQVLHYACKRLDTTVKYFECWIITEDPLFQLSCRANGLSAYDTLSFVKQLNELFSVNYLNTKWISSAMENRMRLDMTVERRGRAKLTVVLEAGVLLKAKTLDGFLHLLEKDRRSSFADGIQVDIPKVVMDRLVEVQRDIGCQYRKPDELIRRAIKIVEKYSGTRRESQLVFHLEPLERYVDGKSAPGGMAREQDEAAALVRYCRRLAMNLSDSHVVALLTDDGGKRKLALTEPFQVVTLWPA